MGKGTRGSAHNYVGIHICGNSGNNIYIQGLFVEIEPKSLFPDLFPNAVFSGNSGNIAGQGRFGCLGTPPL
jgi:hypothetical protein